MLQDEDPTLSAIQKATSGDVSIAGVGFFKEGGLLYRRWTPPGRDEGKKSIEQLVLPQQCQETVLQLVHKVPLAGHMGKTKTGRRILHWPSLFKDVADYCRCCPVCQKCSTRKESRTPLVPLPSVEEPFKRIAMDIVGPLPRSRSGNQYILVICDYVTRYQEAVPLRHTDAQHVAEQLVKLFSRVGVPSEMGVAL